MTLSNPSLVLFVEMITMHKFILSTKPFSNKLNFPAFPRLWEALSVSWIWRESEWGEDGAELDSEGCDDELDSEDLDGDEGLDGDERDCEGREGGDWEADSDRDGDLDLSRDRGSFSGDDKGGVGGLDCGDGVRALVGKTRRPRESVSISSILSENISEFMAKSSS